MSHRGLGEPPLDMRRGREGRVHENDARPDRGIETVVDLLGVVAGDRSVAEQTAEEPGACIGDLVKGKLRSAKIARSPVPAEGSITMSAGVSAAAWAATKPSVIGVENC